ncbi:MAG: hypothetical protein PVG89_08810 [Gammaproteobacteria bacterium]|jgi:hypothetical protein
MNTTNLTRTLLILATLLPVSVLGQEMDHSMMSHDNPQEQQGMNHDEPHDNMSQEHMSMDGDHKEHRGDSPSTMLQRLSALPPSGKSREANYDGNYMMQSTAIDQSLETRCALASRGLMMLDNDAWAKCGGKPKGWSKGIGNNSRSNMEHGNHKNHK